VRALKLTFPKQLAPSGASQFSLEKTSRPTGNLRAIAEEVKR
jgi:hypothetical protein